MPQGHFLCAAVVESMARRGLLAITPAGNDQILTPDANDGTLVLVNKNDGTTTSISTQVDNPQDASFSANRTQILFDGHGTSVETTYEIFTINVDGTGLKRLTTNTSKDYQPHFSPDGSKVVFVSARDGNNELYVMNADGTNQTRLTSNFAAEGHPSFSPDGSKIIFDSDSTGRAQLYTVDAATGGNLIRITNDADYDSGPVYSPDGSRIAFVTYDPNGGGLANVAVIDARGTTEGFAATTLTDSGSVDGFYSPSFSPDGAQIATSHSEPISEGIVEIISADDGKFVKLIPLLHYAQSVSWASAPAFAGINNHVLTLHGTAGNDHVSITNDGMTLTLTMNGQAEPFDINNFASVQIFAGAGNDTVDGSRGAIAFYASGDAGNDELIGGPFNDTLTAGAGRNTLFGGDGDDRLNGSGGRDFLYGEGGNDRMYGNGGNDYMVGGSGVDRMWGGDGDDVLSGNSGNDKLFGENGNDQLLGGDGNDIVYGGLGMDTLNGGKGTDFADHDDADLRIQIEVVP